LRIGNEFGKNGFGGLGGLHSFKNHRRKYESKDSYDELFLKKLLSGINGKGVANVEREF